MPASRMRDAFNALHLLAVAGIKLANESRDIVPKTRVKELTELERDLQSARARIAVLEEALRPFAHGCIRYAVPPELNGPPDTFIADPACCRYCAARAALEGK